MACSGSYCANHCYNNACAGRYRAPRSGNPYTFPDIGGEPTASFTNHKNGEKSGNCKKKL